MAQQRLHFKESLCREAQETSERCSTPLVQTIIHFQGNMSLIYPSNEAVVAYMMGILDKLVAKVLSPPCRINLCEIVHETTEEVMKHYRLSPSPAQTIPPPLLQHLMALSAPTLPNLPPIPSPRPSRMPPIPSLPLSNAPSPYIRGDFQLHSSLDISLFAAVCFHMKRSQYGILWLHVNSEWTVPYGMVGHWFYFCLIDPSHQCRLTYYDCGYRDDCMHLLQQNLLHLAPSLCTSFTLQLVDRNFP